MKSTTEIETPLQAFGVFSSNLVTHGHTLEIDVSDRLNPSVVSFPMPNGATYFYTNDNPLLTWKLIPPVQAAERKSELADAPKPRESYQSHELWPMLVKREYIETVSTLVLELSIVAILLVFLAWLLSTLKKTNEINEQQPLAMLSVVICAGIVFMLLTIAHTVPGVIVPEVEAIRELEYILRDASPNSVLK